MPSFQDCFATGSLVVLAALIVLWGLWIIRSLWRRRVNWLQDAWFMAAGITYTGAIITVIVGVIAVVGRIVLEVAGHD